jgi:hypothetical protein
MTRRPIPALLGAGIVAGFLMVGDVVGMVPYDVWGVLDLFGLGLLLAIGRNLLIGLGVFLVLWLLIPVSATSTIKRAIAAGAISAVGASVFAAVASVLVELVLARQSSGSLYDLMPLNLDPLRLFTHAITTTILVMPLTVLAAVLVREWLRPRAAVDAPKEPVSAV